MICISKLQNKIDNYVSKYAKTYGITKEEALKHKMVQNVIEWMKLRENETNAIRKSVTGI